MVGYMWNFLWNLESKLTKNNTFHRFTAPFSSAPPSPQKNTVTSVSALCFTHSIFFYWSSVSVKKKKTSAIIYHYHETEIALLTLSLGEQGWRSGESARLPPMWPGFDSGPVSYVGWVCCWFSSLLRGFFSGSSGFPPSTKTNTSKFQIDQEYTAPQAYSFNPYRV